MVLQKNLGVINMLQLIINTFFLVAVIAVIGLWILMIKDMFCK
jgi:hypothetical protein